MKSVIDSSFEELKKYRLTISTVAIDNITCACRQQLNKHKFQLTNEDIEWTYIFKDEDQRLCKFHYETYRDLFSLEIDCGAPSYYEGRVFIYFINVSGLTALVLNEDCFKDDQLTN